MGKPKNTLTDWPEDLKDVIDWFLRLAEMDEGGSGYSNKTKLKKAVEKLNGFSKEVSGLGTINVAGFFNKVTNGLQKFIGYDGAYDLTGDGMRRKAVTLLPTMMSRSGRMIPIIPRLLP